MVVLTIHSLCTILRPLLDQEFPLTCWNSFEMKTGTYSNNELKKGIYYEFIITWLKYKTLIK